MSLIYSFIPELPYVCIHTTHRPTDCYSYLRMEAGGPRYPSTSTHPVLVTKNGGREFKMYIRSPVTCGEQVCVDHRHRHRHDGIFWESKRQLTSDVTPLRLHCWTVKSQKSLDNVAESNHNQPRWVQSRETWLNLNRLQTTFKKVQPAQPVSPSLAKNWNAFRTTR